jgi:hypothetical protein
MMRFLITHTAPLLYAGFWLSLVNYGLWAPPERVALLESDLVTKGWHLSLIAVCLGTPVLVLYVSRMRATQPEDVQR